MTGLPRRAPLPATVSPPDTARPGKGPLGALPALSATARRALALTAVLAGFNAALLVAQAFLLASVLASIVGGDATGTVQLTVLAGVVAGRALVSWAVRAVGARAAAGAKEELRGRAIDHALRLGPEWTARRGTAELTALTTRGLDALDAYFTDYLPALVTAAVVPLGAGAAVLFADWPSAVIIAATVPLLPMFAILVGKYTADRVAGATDATHQLSGRLLELVRALPVLAAFRRARAQAEVVRQVSERHRRSTVTTLRTAFASAFVLELAATLSVALVAVVIGVRLAHGDLSLAIGLGVLILAPECFQPIRAVGAAFHASEDGVEAVRRITGILDEPVHANGTLAPTTREVTVRDLRVDRRGGPAPDGLSLTVRPGETVWLRSPSGAGKSTTLGVLLGFVRPDGGTVRIGGHDLADVDLAAWRRQVAWVPQAPAFAGESVRTELELALADRDAEPTPAELTEVLDAVGIAGLLDSPVTSLSTGQRQRVAVARALLRVRHGAWLLLLDEPTAHLDEAAAAQVTAALRATGAAMVVAAHATTDTGANGPLAEPAAVPGPIAPTRTTRRHRLFDRGLAGGALLGAGALLAGVALTAVSGWLIAKASQQPPILTLTVAVVGVRTFGLARATLRYVERLRTHDAALRIATRLRVDLWRTLVRLGPVRVAALRDEVQRRLVDDVDTVRDLLPRVIVPPAVVAIVAAAAVVTQTIVLPSAGAALAAAVIIGSVAAPLLTRWADRRATERLAGGRRDLAASVQALFDATAELVANGAHRTRRAALADADTALTRQARRAATGAGAGEALLVLLLGSATVASVHLAAAAVTNGTLDPVLAPLLALVPLALIEVLGLLPPAAQHAATLRAARARLAALPETEQPAIADGPVRLTGADLRWPDTDRPVLRGVDLAVEPGSWVAVTGPSGAGKSTLLATLLGFLPPDRGTATVPARVAWAPQEPGLVATTVAENLRLADPEADRDRLAAVLAGVGLGDLDQDTLLGTGGSGLSGGQAQRVALARALLAARHADLVLLDEPTAHLDAGTAATVRQTLRRELAGRTVVEVTHRAEDAAAADVVLHVADGKVRTRVRV
ncbi:thiol reductant ABC exporter subunit CydD [Amycolatopsis suaedae]|uniref:Thiol reductant ABC exporter subunit CydD n=1 Tax=Amycolatopsis suaedae TaxID=2510978 RepID=A0A4Q7J4X4_9PSEU|nr:thiol reductant ABC exporter subunit CydD [Amycolatopsis suaedae]RZQ62097.1 thiol reductant ABC exporter subunit CydD [Amycolatopsis suaedae]